MPSQFPVALQLYSVRDEAQKDFPAVLKRVAGMGYEGVEFAGLHGLSPQAVKRHLDDLGLLAATSHGALPTADNVAEIQDTASILGYKWHVVSSLGPDKFTDEATTRKTAEDLAAAIEVMKETGLGVAIHNHWWEFDKRFSGKTPHEIVMDAVPSLCAELDTYWTQVAGVAPQEVLVRLGSRAPLLHIKDGPLNRELPHTAVGAGKMDWAAVMKSAEGHAEWLIVELDSCGTDMMEAVEQSYRFLVDSGYARS